MGDVKVPSIEDFERIRAVCLDEYEWKLEYEKKKVKVWTKRNERSKFSMIKVKAEMDLPAQLVYDVLQDDKYRLKWDKSAIEYKRIGRVSSNSMLVYNIVKFPAPFKNRDTVRQRSWFDLGHNNEKLIYNHSVNHAKFPQNKNYTRCVVYLSASLIKPTSANSCALYYVTQSDPGSSLPTSLMDKVTKGLTPKLVKKLNKACLKYEKWKTKNSFNYKPWTNLMNHSELADIEWNDVLPFDANAKVVLNEDEINLTDLNLDDSDDSD